MRGRAKTALNSRGALDHGRPASKPRADDCVPRAVARLSAALATNPAGRVRAPVILVGIGVVLSPIVRSAWDSESAPELTDRLVNVLPNALAHAVASP
jgi:hypothetical protein